MDPSHRMAVEEVIRSAGQVQQGQATVSVELED